MAPASEQPPENPAALLHAQLERNRSVRAQPGTQPALAAMLVRLREWQSQRLARTYADLLEDKRYRPAAEFFLSDIYGSRDFSRRDEDIERVYPLMVKLLPSPALYTIALAIEANALTMELDNALAAALIELAGRRKRIDTETYAQAYRNCDNFDQRSHQIELVLRIGRSLDAVVSKPMVYHTLRLLRKPAQAAGFGELQEFLERGFVAFRRMAGAEHFLQTVGKRESDILRRIYAAQPDPFGFGE